MKNMNKQLKSDTSTTPPSDIPITTFSSPHNPRPKKRLRKEIGRIGRNLRQKLLCGLFPREIQEDQQPWANDLIMVVEDQLAQMGMEKGNEKDGNIVQSCTEGFREADPIQLPKDR